MILCSDGLTGIKEAIQASFPKTVQQRCIVHIIRNSVKFVYYKDKKEFCNDLKTIYTAKNEKDGYNNLQIVKEKWKNKYPNSLKIGKKIGMPFVPSLIIQILLERLCIQLILLNH